MGMGKATAALASATLAVVAAGGLWVYQSANAADHLDPPSRTDAAVTSTPDVAADIADVFAWNTDSTVTLVVTNAGPRAPGEAPFYDRNVIYQIHVSNDGNPATSERDINVRYGRDAAGNWGVQFEGIPGATGAVAGPVQTVLTNGAVVKATAGLFDDPFFFDLQGFKDTQSTGTLSIRNTRNFFAGKNDTSFVIEFPRSAIENGTNPIQIWAETRRIQGS
ncbi:DUF4331 family protein [Sphingomonas solaris]|uniref:DUF4331 domain-containing protein n=1 Tax=Alterirhizorhabdus solaris TaxID=2529389 RepID=A0A558R0H4_9SPHN|nr:DUF4331 family protein [Sphingomonas solaris]TVV72866.1 DUF4331 domain-containing protein [Sphingomonas solaris]